MHTPPILLPETHAFSELLTYVSEWDSETMSHRSGVVARPDLVPEPRYIVQTVAGPAAIARRIGEIGGFPTAPADRNEVGPYCTVDLSQVGGKRHRGIAVVATDLVMDALTPRIVTSDDHIGFKIIAHAPGRALVIAEHGQILGSHWLAYIDPTTIPAYPYALRDERERELFTALRDAGHPAYKIPRPGGAIELRASRDSPIWATIAADGSVTRSWGDGTISREPSRACMECGGRESDAIHDVAIEDGGCPFVPFHHPADAD